MRLDHLLSKEPVAGTVLWCLVQSVVLPRSWVAMVAVYCGSLASGVVVVLLIVSTALWGVERGW